MHLDKCTGYSNSLSSEVMYISDYLQLKQLFPLILNKYLEVVSSMYFALMKHKKHK